MQGHNFDCNCTPRYKFNQIGDALASFLAIVFAAERVWAERRAGLSFQSFAAEYAMVGAASFKGKGT